MIYLSIYLHLTQPKWRRATKVIIANQFMDLVDYQISFLELKCHCDHCHDTNYICETDGVCYFSWELVDDKFHYSKR